jgi:hypothetical protein
MRLGTFKIHPHLAAIEVIFLSVQNVTSVAYIYFLMPCIPKEWSCWYARYSLMLAASIG